MQDAKSAEAASPEWEPGTRVRRAPARRGNDLDGATWTRRSISVWSDIRKTPAERRLGHPAAFPAELAARLIECFTTAGDDVVLDPFAGSGSTLVAAAAADKRAIGIDVSGAYLEVARERLDEQGAADGKCRLVEADARRLGEHVEAGTVSLCVTSPPYWDVLSRRRTADGRAGPDYGAAAGSLGEAIGYEEFLDRLVEVFEGVRQALQPGRYCIVNVMDIRKRGAFYPLHSDLAGRMRASGWTYDDLIVWDRRQDYNSLRPLGFPAVFRINKVHEYLLIFRKPE